MEKALIQQNRHWQGAYFGLNTRLILFSLLQKLSIKEIQILLGIRRSGKSSVLKLLINHLIQHKNPFEILYINLDDPYFMEIYDDPRQLFNLVEIAEKITGKEITYLFLDEIQNVNSWEKFVKSVYDNDRFKKIFITGSNSTLLKGEYAKLLSGRYIIDEVHPYSFGEILKYNNITNKIELINKKPLVLKIVETMLEFGSFPEVTKHEDVQLKREILLNYYDTIVLKDCVATGQIRDVNKFRNLTHFLISNVGGFYSYNKLAKHIHSNENTVSEYIYFLINSYLLYEIRPFDYSLKKQFKGRKKIYCADNGILANVSFRFSADKGKLFENLVFTELLKNKGEIFFYSGKKECDFIIRKNNQLTAIQVCSELNPQNIDREISGLREAMRNFNIKNGVILTFDQEEADSDFKIIPFWKYFSGY